MDDTLTVEEKAVLRHTLATLKQALQPPAVLRNGLSAQKLASILAGIWFPKLPHRFGAMGMLGGHRLRCGLGVGSGVGAGVGLGYLRANWAQLDGRFRHSMLLWALHHYMQVGRGHSAIAL